MSAPRRHPSLHPSSDLLLDYATGAADLPSRVVLAAHLAQCDACRDEVEALRAPAAGFLRTLGDSPSESTAASASEIDRPPSALWDKLRAAIETEAPARAQEAPRASLGLSLPVAAFAELGPRPPLAWRPLRFSRGIDWAPVTKDPLTGSMLIAVKGPKQMSFPAHQHVGSELGLVLEGGYEDHLGDYRQGDFFAYERGTSHRPFTDLEEGCTSLLRLEAPHRFLGWRRWVFR